VGSFFTSKDTPLYEGRVERLDATFTMTYSTKAKTRSALPGIGMPLPNAIMPFPEGMNCM